MKMQEEAIRQLVHAIWGCTKDNLGKPNDYPVFLTSNGFEVRHLLADNPAGNYVLLNAKREVMVGLTLFDGKGNVKTVNCHTPNEARLINVFLEEIIKQVDSNFFRLFNKNGKIIGTHQDGLTAKLFLDLQTDKILWHGRMRSWEQ